MRSAAHLELVRGSITTAATLAHERTLPVVDDLAEIMPSGVLQRGSTLAMHGVGATSFALAAAGQAVREGSFLAVVAPESFGLSACIDFDIPLRRVVQFVLPAESNSNWAQAVAAIVEGFDIVVLADRHRVSSSQARQLTARNRERGSVLMRVGGPAWPDAADVRFDVSAPAWSGLGRGHGHLGARQVAVQVAGRRYHGRNRLHHLMLPAVGGGVQVAPTAPLTHERFTGAPAVVAVETVEAVEAAEAVETVDSAVGNATDVRFAGADVDAMLDVVDGQAGQALDDQRDAIA